MNYKNEMYTTFYWCITRCLFEVLNIKMNSIRSPPNKMFPKDNRSLKKETNFTTNLYLDWGWIKWIMDNLQTE